MNLVKCETKQTLKEGCMLIKDFRKVDHSKISLFLGNMMENCKKLEENFNYKINIEQDKRNYQSYKEDHMLKINFDMSLGDLKSNFHLKYPELIKDNYFILNGSTYVPLMFLERAPIDKIEKKDEIKIFVNLIPTFNLTFNFKNKTVNIRGKNISLDIFIFVIFGLSDNLDDEDYCQYLVDNNILIENYQNLNSNKCLNEFIKILGIEKSQSFKQYEMNIDEFIDEFIILDYYKEIFNEYFGITTFKDIVKKVFEFKIKNLHPEMADLNNRRVVMVEYLTQPLFDLYIRLLLTIVNRSSKTVKLPTANDRLLITSGFNALMHNGQLFNSSLPYTTPLIHKVSQDIVIIKNGVPRNWTANHDSAFGKICPISVSAQDMGSNLVFTQGTQINKYGKIA